MSLVIWKDGAWRGMNRGDAYYAAQDPDWFTTISLSELYAEIKHAYD